jgi:hypothetical protein
MANLGMLSSDYRGNHVEKVRTQHRRLDCWARIACSSSGAEPRDRGWSLANAVSEPTHLSIPLGQNWAQSQGDNQARIQALGLSGSPKPVTLKEASSSRLIALAGTVAILRSCWRPQRPPRLPISQPCD